MEEEIKVLEEFINRCKECKFATCEQCEINWKQVKAIENLIKGYKELEKYKRKHSLVKNNYIPKSKVRDDIKELEREKNIITGQHIRGIKVYTAMDIVNAEILRLQELLEDNNV